MENKSQQKVYRNIISQFVSMLQKGELKPGDRLPAERVLADMLQISRSSVREALKVMETIGMLTIRRGGGAYVREPDFSPFINTIAPLMVLRDNFQPELLELRELLEVKAAGLAAESEDESIINTLSDIVTRMEQALDLDSSFENAKLDLEFHDCIFRNCKNTLLKKSVSYINSIMEISIKDSREVLMKERVNALKLYNQHKDIFLAISQGDKTLSEERMRNHIRQVIKIYNEIEQKK